jgi:hypothetical protein
MADTDNEKLTAQQPEPQEPELQKEEPTQSTLDQIRQAAKEDDAQPVGTLTLRTILGGDILTADFMRRQIWLFVLIMLFTVVYVAFRYQCQQDMLTIDRLEKELLDAKYKALSSSSNLTEKCRESHVLEVLRQNHDSLLQVSGHPPYIINVPEE